MILPRKEFYMARHGQTEHNVAGVLSADTTQLTDIGVQQAKDAQPIFDLLLQEKDLLIYTSALGRAKHTAIHMVDVLPTQLWEDEGLNERNLGEEVGKTTFADYIERAEEILADGGTLSDEFSGMESIEDHSKRVIKSLNERLNQCPNNRVLALICHEGVISRVVEHMGVGGSHSASPKFDNAGVYHFEPVGESAWRISKTEIQEGKLIDTKLWETGKAIKRQPSVSK